MAHKRRESFTPPFPTRYLFIARFSPLGKQQIYYLWQSVAVMADREVFKRCSTYTFNLAYLYAIDLKFSKFSTIRRYIRKQRSSPRNRHEIIAFFPHAKRRSVQCAVSVIYSQAITRLHIRPRKILFADPRKKIFFMYALKNRRIKSLFWIEKH